MGVAEAARALAVHLGRVQWVRRHGQPGAGAGLRPGPVLLLELWGRGGEVGKAIQIIKEPEAETIARLRRQLVQAEWERDRLREAIRGYVAGCESVAECFAAVKDLLEARG